MKNYVKEGQKLLLYADYMKQVNRCIPWPPHNI